MLKLEEPESLSFDCKLTDLVCVASEGIAQGLGEFLSWLAQEVLGGQNVAPGTTLWENAISETGNWFAIAIIVLLATAVIGLATGMLSLKPRNVWYSIGGLAAAIPCTYLALGVGGELLTISHDLSMLTLERLGGPDGFQNLIRSALQRGSGSDKAGAAAALLSGPQAAAPTIGMLLLIIVGMLFMAFALAFRNLGLMILIAFSPMAFMAVPLKGGWELPKKWGLAFVALLLSEPLMFGVLAMLLKASKDMTLFSPQTLTIITGLFVVAFMPMMAYSFFQFLGSGHENQAGQQVAGGAAQKATGAARTATGAAGNVGRFALSKGSPGAVGTAGKPAAPVSAQRPAAPKDGAGGSQAAPKDGANASPQAPSSPQAPASPQAPKAPGQSPPLPGPGPSSTPRW